MSASFFSDLEEDSQDSNSFFSDLDTAAEEVQEPKRSFWDKLGEAFSLQMQSGGFSGAPSLTPEQAKKVATYVGAQAAVSGAFAPLKYLASLAPYAPRALSFITGLGEAAATGMAIPTAEALVEGGELPTKEELLKEGALWAGMDLAMQAAGGGFGFIREMNRLSAKYNVPKSTVIRAVWEDAKRKFGWKEPPVDPETGVKIILPEQIEAMTDLAEKNPEILVGEAEKIEEPPLPEIQVEEKKLTPQQIKNRKIAAAERKKALQRAEEDLRDRKLQAEKERMVAFRSLGITEPKEAEVDVKEEILQPNEDALEMEDAEEDELSPEDTVKAQSFAEIQLLQDKVSKKLSGIYGKFDIERPFQAIGTPNTGRAVKLFHDTINAYLEEAKGVVKQISALNLSKDQIWDAFLAAESGKNLPTPEMNQARDLFIQYFHQSFIKYQEAGGLSLPWPFSAIQRLHQNIVDLETRLSAQNIRKQAKNQIKREIKNINLAISILEKLRYIPKSASLITQALADSLGTVNPKYMQKYAIAAHKKRTTGALSDWIEDEPMIKELLHPYDFIGDYAYKKGKDLGLLRITKNAIDEGLASKGTKLGFKMDPFKFPALAGYNVHPALYEYINNLVNPVPFNTYDKISRWAKSSIVFDPLYAGVLLPYFRTLMQHPKFLARIPKYWKKALHDYLNKTPAYVEFVENGGASNPYPATEDFKQWLQKEKLDNGSLQQIIFNSILTKEGVKDYLNKMADFSWMIDRLARLAYYNMLLDKGFSSRDAAKLSAENFVDYSKLPARTRRWVSRLFFAPATQILSVLNDFALVISPLKLVKAFMEGKENFQNGKINKERVGLLLGTIIVLGGISALYKMWGFKEEEFGTRYVSPEYEDKDGKLKEAVVTPTHPMNYSLRWINTFLRGFGPGESSPIQKIWGRMVNQIGPIPNMVMELGKNKDRNGKHIWDPIGDDAITASAKVLKYILGRIEPFSIEKFHTTEDQKAAKGKIKEMMGWAEWFMDSLEFFYERKPESQRRKNKINYLKREMKRLQKSGELTEKARERYLRQIEELTEHSNNP